MGLHMCTRRSNMVGGNAVVRFYDPDRHIIEVGEKHGVPLSGVFIDSGLDR